MNSIPVTMIPKPQIYRLRLQPFVDNLITGDQVYLEKFSQEQWLDYIATTMEELPFEQFLKVTDDDLKGRIGRLMSLQLVAGMLNDLTSTQLQAFDEALVRR